MTSKLLNPQRLRWLALTAGAALCVAGVAHLDLRPTGDGAGDDNHGPSAALRVRDEAGHPVRGASVTIGGSTVKTGDDGAARTELPKGPALAVVSAPGFLAEPVPLHGSGGRDPVPVTLLSSHGGKRFVLHSAGDVMFGRRYEEAAHGEPLIPKTDPAAAARSVVDAVAPAFRAADLRTVNLESTVADRAMSQAYPKKRFILETPPSTLAGLKQLGVDVPVTANNHVRDFLDAGLADTRSALTAAGFPVVGLTTGDTPQVPYRTNVHGTSLAMLAYTSVDGSFVNDSYPTTGNEPQESADVVPADHAEVWQQQLRRWGFAGRTATVPVAPRRIGEAWRVFRGLERRLQPDEAAECWASLAKVYPELQDWVARRGHAGAARWDPDTTPQQIRQVSAGAQLTVVQMHSGFQFQHASGDALRAMARSAIDSGADIVICHHPHVLQGLEWYKGKLIAYSLGNFVFDQDFLATFASAFLRTVWEGDHLVQARLVPVEIDGYRPVPVGGAAARRTLLGAWEDSLRSETTVRGPDHLVWTVPASRDAESAPAQLTLDHDTALVTAKPPPVTPVPLTVPPHGQVPLGVAGVIDPRPASGGTDGLLVGRDLLGWGRFQDDTADGAVDGATHWTLGTASSVQTDTSAADNDVLRITARRGAPTATVHPVARIPLPRHRLHNLTRTGAEALDPPATYSLQLRVRISGSAKATVRLGVYHFDDSDPAEDPTSDLLTDIVRPLAVPADNAWHVVTIDLGPRDLDSGGSVGNMVLPHVDVATQERGTTGTVDLDDVSFVEWRPATGMPAGWGRYDFVRNAGDHPARPTFRAMKA